MLIFTTILGRSENGFRQDSPLPALMIKSKTNHCLKNLLFFLITILPSTVFGQVGQLLNPHDFVPKGYVVVEEINGDLNKDDIKDLVLILKGTDKNKIIPDDERGMIDRNRRGIMVLLHKNGRYEVAIKNTECFSSENEDGGVYFAPELSVEIERSKLYVHYDHGRYGTWQYTFRLQNLDLELIGYDQSDNRGPIVEKETSINFITKKKQLIVNTNEDAEGGDEVFKETWKNIKVNRLIKLSEIKDFDELDMSVY